MIIDWPSFVALGLALGCLAAGQFCLVQDAAELRRRLMDAEGRLAELPPYREARPYAMTSLESRR